MAVRLWALVVLIGSAAVASSLDDSSENSLVENTFDKREFKLRSHNPLHIYNQWLRQPRYPTKVNGLRDEPNAVVAAVTSAGHDIPRRLIRNNKTHLGAPPLFVWNHQLLPNFQQNKRQPPYYFTSLRRDYTASRSAKRSRLASILLPKAYEAQRYDEPRLNSGEAGYEVADAENDDF